MRTEKYKIEAKELYAGDFSSWLSKTRDMLLMNTCAKVPCDDCRACCTSSLFIHIKPDEKQTLKQIKKELLVDAPGMPKGNVLLGYSENGYCPMFIDNNCSIYPFRPSTCKSYDCRIYVAAGVNVDSDSKGLISNQIQRWKFNYPAKNDKEQHFAVQNAAKFISENQELFPNRKIPQKAIELAILAIKVYEVFLSAEVICKTGTHTLSKREIACKIIESYERFEESRLMR